MLYTIKWPLLYAITHPLGGPHHDHVFLEIVLIHLAIEKDMDFQRKAYGCCILKFWTPYRII